MVSLVALCDEIEIMRSRFIEAQVWPEINVREGDVTNDEVFEWEQWAAERWRQLYPFAEAVLTGERVTRD